MSNQNGNAYALTTLCPIRSGGPERGERDCLPGQSYAACIRNRLQGFGADLESPMAKVPNTYLCRFFVMDDVVFEGTPAEFDQLKSRYLVFESSFYGELEPYLEGMWLHAGAAVREIWEHCVAFDRVHDAPAFVAYIKKCQVETTFFFNGSTDDSLAEQLKSLYLKQEFSKFAFENQDRRPEEIQRAFREFVARVQPAELAGPSWRPGAGTLIDAVGQ